MKDKIIEDLDCSQYQIGEDFRLFMVRLPEKIYVVGIGGPCLGMNTVEAMLDTAHQAGRIPSAGPLSSRPLETHHLRHDDIHIETIIRYAPPNLPLDETFYFLPAFAGESNGPSTTGERVD